MSWVARAKRVAALVWAGEGVARAKQMAAKREALRDRTLDYRFVVAAAARNVNESIDHEIVFI
jgi:hypothetical protein